MGCTSSKPVYRPAGAFSSPLSSGAGPKNTSLPTAASGSLAATSAPSVGVFPANSRAGLAVLKALVSYPLYDASRPVVAICRSEQAAEEIRSALGSDKKDRVQVRTDADMQDLDGCAKQFAGVGALFMHAPNCEDSHSLLCNAIDAAAKSGTVQHLVLLSMLGADTSGNALARQCREAEMRVESQPGMSFTHLRSGFFMENWLSSRQSIMTKGTFFGSFDPSSALPLVSMQDVGLAAATVLCGPAKYANVALHLTGPDALTGGEVAGAMSKAFGRAVTYSYIPGPSFEASLKALGVPAWQAVQMVERFELLSRIGEELASTDVWRVTGGVHTTLERFLQLQRSAFTQGLPPLVCVLPGRGLLGLAVLRALHGCRVRAVVQTREKQTVVQEMFPEVEVVAADMMDFDALDAALQGCDVCVLAPPSTELRVALGMNAINACCKQGATHIVLVSVLADGNGDLGAEFGAMEKAVEAGEAGFTVLRVPVFMQTLLAAALGAGALCLPHGQELAPVDVEDVARVVREICVQAGGASVFWGRHLDLTGPARLTCADMAKIASELVGRRVNARITTIQEFSRCLVQAGTSPSAAKAAAEHVCFATPVSPHVLQVTGLHTSFQQFAARHKQDFGRIS